MNEPDRSKLPIRRPAFGGTAARTLQGCQPDWALIDHVHPPAGAPNVLVVLIDDAGFGNPSTFGGPIDTPNFTRMAEGGLRYNRFHVTALCSPTRAALLTGRNSHTRRIRLSRGVLQRLPRLHRRSPTRLRSTTPGPARQRVQHRCVRQVAPHAGRPTGTGRPLRPVAERVGLRLLLRVPGRRREPVGPVHGREPEDHRNGPRLLRRGQPLLPARRHGRQDDPVAARSAGAGRDQTVLRLLLHRVQPRATPRGRQLGREVQGSIRPGLGPHARGGVRAAATARGRSRRIPS